MLDVHVFRGPAAASAIGERLARDIASVVAVKPTAVIGLTTGTTPLKTGVYAKLLALQASGGVDLSQAHLVSPDEWIGLPLVHKECYHAYIRAHLVDHLAHFDAAANWVVANGNAANALAECARLDAALHAVGGVDYQLLGLGINGHLCFIEPAAEIPAGFYVTRIAEVNRELYAGDFGGDLAAVPTHAITYGLGTLLAARHLSLAAVGEKKAPLVARALTAPFTTHFPGTVLQIHPSVSVYLDEAAAAELPADFSSRSGVTLTFHD